MRGGVRGEVRGGESERKGDRRGEVTELGERGRQTETDTNALHKSGSEFAMCCVLRRAGCARAEEERRRVERGLQTRRQSAAHGDGRLGQEKRGIRYRCHQSPWYAHHRQSQLYLNFDINMI